MISILCVMVSALVASPCVANGDAALAGPLAELPRVKALFLGDHGHHRPKVLFDELVKGLSTQGILLDYTSDVHDLEPGLLAKYDALVVYANIDEIGKAEERALLDFVASGHGLVALHCASYCFRNSDAYVELVGAQFDHHSTGTFGTIAAEIDHPILRGYMPFVSWDETYVHTRHNQDRTVLEWRSEGSQREPYTWVRTHEKGRVFYTAWGHDERTWTHPGFADLVERGLRWSAGDRFMAPLKPLPKFEYEEAQVPLYRPEGGTGLESKMQKALSPAEEREYLVPAAGFDVQLFASEPDIRPAIAMAWDERGRLWLAESVDYPNDKLPLGQGHDSLKICEDTDGDGRADRFTMFADGLSIPTSIVFANGGVIVSSPPDMLFLADRDGDGKADERKVLFTGFGVGDTHAGPSNLRYGFDGWIWGTVGYSGFDGTVGGVHNAFGQGIYRFKPDGSALEFLGSTTNNTWGLGFDESGEVFCSTANHDQINHLAIPNRVYESVAGWHGRGISYIADYDRIHPITSRVRQVDWHGQFTAAAGCAIYTARLFPREWWNSVALICEPTGHLVHASKLEPHGASFIAHDGGNLLAGRDEWFAPIAAEVGPDGAVWVDDWYSYIVQHNPTPAGFPTGKGGAYVTPLRNKKQARIWRVVPTGTKPSKPRSLADATDQQLVEALGDDNLFWRMHAQRLLVERSVGERSRTILDRLVDVLKTREDYPVIDGQIVRRAKPIRVHALVTLAQLPGAKPSPDAIGAATVARTNIDPHMRRLALRVGALASELDATWIGPKLLADADAMVQREALLTLAGKPMSEGAGRSVYSVLDDPRFAQDPVLRDAATAAAAKHANGYLAALVEHMRDEQKKVTAKASAKKASDEPVNLLPNPSFEVGSGSAPDGWRVRTYSGRVEQHWVDGGRNGGKCLAIESTSGADSSWFVDAPVEKDARYELSGWVKSENVDGAMGVLFNVHAQPEAVLTGALKGTSDWTHVSVAFDSNDQTTVSINCLFGGWGHSRGKGWFDDVSLVRLRSGADVGSLTREQGRVLETVLTHCVRSPDKSGLWPLLTALGDTPEDVQSWTLDTLARTWPKGAELAPLELPESVRAGLLALIHTIPASRQASLLELARRWKHPELFAVEEPLVLDGLRKSVGDAEQSIAARLHSAELLLALDPSDATVKMVASSIHAADDPDLGAGFLRALAASPSPLVARALLERWSELTPNARRAAIALFIQRPTWSSALLDAIEKSTIARTDLRAQDWQALELAQDPALVARAKSVHGQSAGATSEGRTRVLERLMPATALTGDLDRGHAIFKEKCMVCHTLRGEGGPVGPALDGIGVRDPKDILPEIVDPNRSVEANYRAWLVLTKDGLMKTGRIANETRTSIELIDATAVKSVIERADIETLKAQNVSVMPEGLLDELTPQDVAALLAWLRGK